MMTAVTSSDIIAILEDMRENQVVGTQDIQKIPDCKETKARRIINEMKKNKIIVAITGSGKGRYILNTLQWFVMWQKKMCRKRIENKQTGNIYSLLKYGLN